MLNKRAQVSIFIILAIVIVAGVIVFFTFRENILPSGVPSKFRPIYDAYDLCIEEQTRVALSLAGTQSGHVYVQNYEAGSDYSPFSSQLNFMGFAVPYWYYLSSNGVIKENVPSKGQIEREIQQYIQNNLNKKCDFSQFYDQGYNINISSPKVKVSIGDNAVDVDVSSNLGVSKDDSSAFVSDHPVQVKSSFGKFYNEALVIYNKEKNEAFLENYSVDTLNLYAPVDGTDLSCSPRVWKSREVIDQLQEGLVGNVAALKFKGGDYSLKNNSDKYFVIDQEISDNANLIYSKSWPSRFDIYGASGELMTAEPVGNQQGLGIMGFCYAPYHFVYDVKYPVLIQLYNDNEIFQFPVVVIIDKNVPRNAITSEINYGTDQDLCKYADKDVTINLYDNQLNKVDSNVSYQCFDQVCDLGESQNGILQTKVPSCVNGYLISKNGDYAEKKQLFSSNKEVSADIVLDRQYDVNVDLMVGGNKLKEGDNAIIFLSNADNSISLSLRDSNHIKLSEGDYNLSVYVYSNTSIAIPATTKQQCATVSAGGVGGFFGATQEKCFTIDFPAQNIDSALIGGGKTEVYLLPGDLEKGKMTINSGSLTYPTSLEQLQYNFQSFDSLKTDVNFE